MKYYEMTGRELSGLLERKEISSRELTENYLDRIENVDSSLGSYLTVSTESALAKAGEIDRKRAQGEKLSPLAGLPVGIKDNISTKGVRTTCGSRMLENYIPPYSAEVVEKLERNGAVILGKCNMDAFAMGSSTETSYFGPTRNPWDLSRVPGGSSGGPAAAVGAGEAVFTIGSDTGGSIRQPASLCGVVGFKPTYGRVSRYGLLAYASSLDQIGPFTRDISDAAMVLEAISGYDRKDSTSADIPAGAYTQSLNRDIRGLRIGVPREYFGEGIEKNVKEIVYAAIKKYEEMGAVVEECSMPHTEYALPAYYIISPAECSSNLARFDGVRYGFRASDAENVLDMFTRSRAEGFEHEVKKRIMLGTYVLSSGYYDAYYLKALKVRQLVRKDFDKAFEKYDVLMAPTAPNRAFAFGEKSGDELAMYMQDICTATINLAGVPAVSIPCGFDEGLPVGLQIIARPFREEDLVGAAHAYERETGIHKERPRLEVE